MSFRFRIAAWVVVSCALLISVMIFTAHRQLEEELRSGRKDPSHPVNPDWVIHNTYAEAEIQDILDELLDIWIWTAAPIMVLSLGAGLLLARRSLRPVHDINRQLSAMRPDSLHGGITIPEADPAIEGLANHLNGLLERAGTAYQEMSEFSARVAHELRTPLMLLRMRVEHAPPGMPPEFQEDLQDELARLSRFVERSLLAAKAEQGALVPAPVSLCLSDLVRDLSELYQLLASERGLEMSLGITADIHIHADADLLRQVLHGLLENAVHYAKSKVRISCSPHQGEPVLNIQNDMDPVTIASGGLGLGLRLVRGICKASGWEFAMVGTDGDFRATIRFKAGNPLAFDANGE
jgi:signal transduction histidine kinase